MSCKEVRTFWLDMGAPMGLLSRSSDSRLSTNRVARPVKWTAYDGRMRNLPTILLVLSLPAGLVGWLVGSAVVNAILPGNVGVLALFVPLLVAGLCMMPFLIPYLDRKAKADLAAHRREEALKSGTEAASPTEDDA